MAWAVVQSGSNTVTSGGNGTFTFGTNLTSGTKIICYIVVSFTDTIDPVSGIADGSGNQLTRIKAPPGGNSNTWTEIWAMDTPAGDVGTKPTLTATVVSNFGVTMIVQEVSGLLSGNTTAMVDGTGAFNSGTASPATSGSYTTTAANEFLVGLYGDPGDNVTVTNASGYTAETHNVNADNFATAFVSYKNSTNGSESASWTLSGAATDGWETILVAFKLAGGSPVSVSGVVAAITVAAPSGSVLISSSGAASSIAVTAQPGSIQESISGVASNITVAGIPGSITTSIFGTTSQINVSAQSGSVSVSLAGVTGLISVSAISGSVSESISGTTSSITVVATPGSIAQSINIIGVTSVISVIAHPGQASAQLSNVVITGSLNSKDWTGVFLKNTSGKLINTNWNGNILKS